MQYKLPVGIAVLRLSGTRGLTGRGRLIALCIATAALAMFGVPPNAEAGTVSGDPSTRSGEGLASFPLLAARSAAEIEDELWNSIKDSTDPSDFDEYLKNYPNGRYKAFASRRLRQLKEGSSAQVPSAAGGHGRLTLPDGGHYEGSISDGRPNGKGIVFYGNGTTYEGDWVDGRVEGKGSLTLPNHDRYEGQFRDNKRNGKGVYFYADGRGGLEGTFAENKFVYGTEFASDGRQIARISNGARTALTPSGRVSEKAETSSSGVVDFKPVGSTQLCKELLSDSAISGKSWQSLPSYSDTSFQYNFVQESGGCLIYMKGTPLAGQSTVWNGACEAGKANGQGVWIFRSLIQGIDSEWSTKGEMKGGKFIGRVLTSMKTKADGKIISQVQGLGEYVDGKSVDSCSIDKLSGSISRSENDVIYMIK